MNAASPPWAGKWVALALAIVLLATGQANGQTLELEPRLVHLRNVEPREWSSFPASAQAARLSLRFTAAKNAAEHVLRLRQQDVKQAWRVRLNGQGLGELMRDENDMLVYLEIPTGTLQAGANTLEIESPAEVADDIRVGEITIQGRSRQAALSDATVEIRVVDEADKAGLPARITVVNARGALQTTSAVSSDHVAARPGVIYTATGQAQFGLPAGSYRIYAGRGFEYSLASVNVDMATGDVARHTLSIRREVSTAGYVACDTHIHTLTFSGHGDATIDERMITLAGEGIELPIATDHNVHIDYEQHAQRLDVRERFTPVVGNEVTTPVGHFNVFPVEPKAKPPNQRLREWGAIFDQIFATPSVRVAILNHARDRHSGVRPFGPERFNAAIGENVVGWPLRFNGMEIINSGAVQSDPLRLPRDWMALLNRGYRVTPVGSSDSHDVARHFVGQGRTYIRCGDRQVDKLNVAEAIESFLAGRVLVSYGLLCELTAEGRFGAGELASPSGEALELDIRVLGPHWTSAARVLLFANGDLVREEAIEAPAGESPQSGQKWRGTWRMPRPEHDVHLVAIALGRGVDGLYWPTAKPYQPTSPDFEPYVLGVSGAVWIDGDGDGRRSAARAYAEQAVAAAGGSPPKLIAALGKYDAAVAAQAAHEFRATGGALRGPEYESAMKSAAPAVKEGFARYLDAAREHELARAVQD